MEKIWVGSYAEGVPESVNFRDITLHEGLTRTAAQFPDNPALIFFGKSINYRDLNVMVSTFASALQGTGGETGGQGGAPPPEPRSNGRGSSCHIEARRNSGSQQSSLHRQRAGTSVQ